MLEKPDHSVPFFSKSVGNIYSQRFHSPNVADFKRRLKIYSSKEKRTKPKLHPSSFLTQLSILRRIAFRAVEVVEIFGFNNVQSGIAQALLKRNQLVFVNYIFLLINRF